MKVMLCSGGTLAVVDVVIAEKVHVPSRTFAFCVTFNAPKKREGP